MRTVIKILKVSFYTIASVAALYLLISGLLEIYPNFHTVIPGKIYRSAEMPETAYIHYIKKYHIKSMLNLEGGNISEGWYRNEINASKKTGVKHINYYLHAKGVLSAKQLRDLAHIIKTAPKPLLIHCWRGADRTGLGSVMALLIFTNQPLAQIKKQLAWHYGVMSKESVGLLEVALYEKWLQQQSLKSSPQNFQRWLSTLKAEN